MKTMTAEQWGALCPGLLDELERRGVDVSNNVGAIIVDGYLGDVIGAYLVTTS